MIDKNFFAQRHGLRAADSIVGGVPGRARMGARAGAVATAIGLASLLGGCGGGGNESGDYDTVEVSPSAVLVGTPGNCISGVGPTVHVFGGQPPYKLSNSVPNALSLDKTRVTASGDGFTITFLPGGCIQNMPIDVEDDMGRITHVVVTNGY